MFFKNEALSKDSNTIRAVSKKLYSYVVFSGNNHLTSLMEKQPLCAVIHKLQQYIKLYHPDANQDALL